MYCARRQPSSCGGRRKPSVIPEAEAQPRLSGIGMCEVPDRDASIASGMTGGS